MNAKELIVRSLEQSQGYLTRALDGLTQEEAAWSPKPDCNSIAFILWHIARVEDIFVNDIIRQEIELYEAKGWREKMGTPANESGWQYTLEQLKAWPVLKLEVIRGYAEAVRKKTLAFLESLPPNRLSKKVKFGDTTNSIGMILSRYSTELTLHIGQICYLRGIHRGLNK